MTGSLQKLEEILVSSRLKFLKQCGVLNYYKLNRNISSGNLISVPYVTGFADRILGVASLFLLSVVSSRTFCIALLPELHLEDLRLAFYIPHKYDLFCDSIPDWAVKPLLEIDPREGKRKYYLQHGFKNGSFYVVNALDDNFNENGMLLKYEFFRRLQQHRNFQTLLVSLNHGMLLKLYDSEHTSSTLKVTRIPRDIAFGCAINYLFLPRMKIFLPIKDQLKVMLNGLHHTKNFSNKTFINIVIHIRTGDTAFNSSLDRSTVNEFKHFFSCAQKVENKIRAVIQEYVHLSDHEPDNAPLLKWHLFTDSISLRTDAKQIYGGKLMTTMINTEHSSGAIQILGTLNSLAKKCDKEHCVSKDGFLNAVAEWWVMGEADYFVIGENSGYGKTAAFRKYRPKTIYSVRRKVFKKKVTYTCVEDDFDNFRDYSGL